MQHVVATHWWGLGAPRLCELKLSSWGGRLHTTRLVDCLRLVFVAVSPLLYLTISFASCASCRGRRSNYISCVMPGAGGLDRACRSLCRVRRCRSLRCVLCYNIDLQRMERNLGQQETSSATDLSTQLHVHAHLAAQHRDTAHSFSCPHPSPPLPSARNDQSTQSCIHVLCTIVHPHIGCVVPSGGDYGSPCTFCVTCREPQSHKGVARGRVAAAPGAACEAARLCPLYFSRNASPKIWNAMNKPA